MIVKLLTERHLEFLSLKEGWTGSSESTLVKMSNCWKSRALAQIIFQSVYLNAHFRYLAFKSNPRDQSVCKVKTVACILFYVSFSLDLQHDHLQIKLKQCFLTEENYVP